LTRAVSKTYLARARVALLSTYIDLPQPGIKPSLGRVGLQRGHVPSQVISTGFLLGSLLDFFHKV